MLSFKMHSLNTQHIELKIKQDTDHVHIKVGWHAVFGRVKMVEVTHKCQWSRSKKVARKAFFDAFYLLESCSTRSWFEEKSCANTSGLPIRECEL